MAEELPRIVRIRSRERAYPYRDCDIELELRQISRACADGVGRCSSLLPDGSMCACGCHWTSGREFHTGDSVDDRLR